MGEPSPRTIRIAILAMGGEGGGVLANWIVNIAEHAGWIAQLTSIPGVAQRTGATNYYIEMMAPDGVRPSGSDTMARTPDTAAPVMALSPMPGDVDVVVASELMEAGRAIQRGIVTPDRTTLVTSTSRVFALTEKLAPGDGRTDDAALLEASRLAAQRLVACDMGAIAEETGSVISAVMFGALAGARTLPFDRAQFEATIERSGIGVAASKRGFARGWAAARGEETSTPAPPAGPQSASPAARSVFTAALTEASTAFPEPAREIVLEGVRRLTDYQDAAYARLYLTRLAPITTLESQHGDSSRRLTCETARYLALGMAYEDTIRVAELKIRASRFERVSREVRAEPEQVVEVAEFLHPRRQEIADSSPAWIGRRVERGLAGRLVDLFTSKGRIVKTTSVRGFLLLYMLARRKPKRRATLRFPREQKSLEAWLALIETTAPRDYALACEIAECRNLVKGYGDTHARGTAKYERILGLLPRLEGHTDPARHIALLRKAALADEEPAKLEEAIGRLDLAEPAPA